MVSSSITIRALTRERNAANRFYRLVIGFLSLWSIESQL